jgi:CHAT domain-containing protein
LRSLREEYIVEVFKIKNKFAKNSTGDNGQEKKDEVYNSLITIIQSFIDKMTRMEKNKYMRERLFYQRENQIVLYEEANKKYHDCENEVKDNLIKMAKTICQPNETDFIKYLDSFKLDYTNAAVVGNIGEQISERQAQNFANIWSDIQNNHN